MALLTPQPHWVRGESEGVMSFFLCSCLSIWKISIFVGAMENLWMLHQKLYLRKRCGNYKGKKFRCVNLRGADLRNSQLSRANLKCTFLCDVDLANISWDEYTIWKSVQGLETAKNVPEALKRQLGMG